MQLMIPTKTKRQVIDITDEVTHQISGSDKAVLVFVLHTTAAITTADLDPGTDLDLLVENGKLVLGTWQRIILVDFDGPRKRSVMVKAL